METDSPDKCETVREYTLSVALAAAERKLAAVAADAERKLAAVAESNECAVCMGHKDHILIPCGHVCVCEQCANSIMASSKQCPVCRSTVMHICKVYS